MPTLPQPDRGYMEFGRWHGALFGLNMSCFLGNIIRNSRHWMYGVEVLCMLREAHTVWVDGVAHRLEAGDLLTIDSFQTHEIYDGSPGGLQIMFNFDESLLRRSGAVRLALSTVGEHALPRTHPDVCAARRAMLSLAEVTDHHLRLYVADGGVTVSDAEWFAARQHFYELLKLLSRHQIPAESAQPGSPMLLAACIRDIHEHYAEPLTIGMLAERYNYSQSSLYRLFRQNLGVSFLEYLTSVRLNIACGMLMKQEHSVMEVSELCGFSTYSNFYRVFKANMGMSPTAYQEQSGVAAPAPWSASDLDPLYRHNQFEPFLMTSAAAWQSARELLNELEQVTES